MVVAGLAGCTAALVPAAADACGGLIGENGTIELVRTTTLAAYSDGVERYVTAFEFTGEGESVGSIVPLPDVPTTVERGGDWTLQRLALEVAPPAAREGDDAAEATVAASAEVEIVLETQIDALDITVLKGGGDEVGQWALENGFLLTPDAPEVLDFYAQRSPVFMAAKFDAQRALALGQGAGDSTPIMATIPTDDPWVPVRILGLGLDEHRDVEADVFLLTDQRPELLAGGPGLTLERSEAASSGLLADLRSDVGMEWVPDSMWLSYLQLDAEAGDLDYDLAVSQEPAGEPSITDAGVGPASVVPVRPAPGERALVADRPRRRRRRRRPRAGDAQGGVVRYLLAVLASLTVAVATTRRRLPPRQRRSGGRRGARSRRRHGRRRRRAQPLRAVVRPCRRRHRGPLRRQQRRPDQPRADRRPRRRPRPPPRRHRAAPRAEERRALGRSRRAGRDVLRVRRAGHRGDGLPPPGPLRLRDARQGRGRRSTVIRGAGQDTRRPCACRRARPAPHVPPRRSGRHAGRRVAAAAAGAARAAPGTSRVGGRGDRGALAGAAAAGSGGGAAEPPLPASPGAARR